MRRTICWRIAVVAVAGAWLAGCTSRPPDQGLREIRDLVVARDAGVPTAGLQSTTETERAVMALLAQPLSADAAVQIAVLRNPLLRIEYARLGLAEADVLDASRLSNPTLSGSVLDPRTPGMPVRIDAGLSQSFTDLLLLKPRKRLAAGEYRRTQQAIGASILELAADARAAWYTDVGAHHIATLRDAGAKAAQASADLAARFHDAGNISALQLNLELAAATQARLASVRAHAEAVRTHAVLERLMGVQDSERRWTTVDRLPAPVSIEDSAEELLGMAAQSRLDVAAARREVDLLEDALGITQHYRWLGTIDIGISGERDTDRTRLLGPTLAVQLPIFNQGQGAMARARARLEDSRARLQSLELGVESAVRLGTERVHAARAVLEEYRTALIPEREAVVARTQEHVNYMFAGAFDLLLAKQQEFDAYQGYLEAVRDYWLARVDLARAVGTRLPSETSVGEPTLGPDSTPSVAHAEEAGTMPGMDVTDPPTRSDTHDAPPTPHPSAPTHPDESGGGTP